MRRGCQRPTSILHFFSNPQPHSSEKPVEKKVRAGSRKSTVERDKPCGSTGVLREDHRAQRGTGPFGIRDYFVVGAACEVAEPSLGVAK